MPSTPSARPGPGAADRAPLPPSLDPRGRLAGTRAGGGSRRADASQGRSSRAKDLRYGAAWGARIAGALMSLVILVGSGWAWSVYRDLESNRTIADALPAGALTPEDGVSLINDGKDQNIVLVGKDDRETATDAELAELGTERDGGSLNTDTMMILHVPADGAKATLISFPRDSWVTIPGYGQNKLNAAYSLGSDSGAKPDAGRKLLVTVLQNMTGLTIDHYVEIDLIGFYRISNAIGGVDVNLCSAQYDEFSGIDLPAGLSTIQGTQALAFVRQRHGLDGGDLDRTARQRYFLTQVFQKVQSAGTLLNPFKLKDLVGAVSSSLTTDSSLDFFELAKQMQNLTGGGITEANIPTLGTDTINGLSVVVVDFAGMSDFIATVIGTATDSTLGDAKTVAPGSFVVDVLNGAGVSGIAGANAAALTALGFSVGAVTDGNATSVTTIRYPDGQQSQAKTLAAQVPGATMIKTDTVSRVTLIIGSNKLQVSSLNPTASSAPTVTPVVPDTGNKTTDTRNGADTGCIN
ncbi:MAG: LytR family transcriptional regulator [Pseudonocardiales bacterium]|nr:LytR family transcriptional regulator [Pseudonocardiales bacterium]